MSSQCRSSLTGASAPHPAPLGKPASDISENQPGRRERWEGQEKEGEGGSTLATVDWQRLKAVFEKSEKAEAGMMAQSVKWLPRARQP